MEGTGELEFEQAYNEVVSCLNASSLFEKEPRYKKVLSVISIPQRVIQFRVSWENDNGEQETTVGYRVQFNNALGPFKGGLRFHPSVNLSILKFLGFEQIFKNALTNQPIGGGKGGLRVDLKGRSDSEVRKICYAFMTELSRHIGQDIDVPAGDIGVGKREIGYMFGAFRTFRNSWEGSLTGKGLDWGGSLIRPEATGYGLIYFLCEMIKLVTNDTESLSGKRIIISGSGNVAQYAALKAIELGATVISLSDSKGSLIFRKGVTVNQMKVVAEAKLNSQALEDILSTEEFVNTDMEYIRGARPWSHVDKADIALPCATENEVSGEEAEVLIQKGVRYVAEGSNMGSTIEAIDVFERMRTSAKSKDDPFVFYAPGKASNLGGVLVSALEMAQNSQRIPWSSANVDGELMKGMKNAFKVSVETAHEYSKEGDGVLLPSIVLGANLAGFIKVADAMFEQGDVF